MSDPDSNFDAARQFIDFGWKQQELGRRESMSGPGSALAAAAPTLALLNQAIAEYEIASILDLGCGDWNWMQRASWRSDPAVRYEGWEAHEGLVARLNAQFAGPNVRFRLADIITEPLPPSDLVICRDVLFHLPVRLAIRLLERLRASGRFLLATSFLDQPANDDIQNYLPIPNWGFHLINLDVAPFDLGEGRIKTLPEPACVSGGSQRSVCLYRL